MIENLFIRYCILLYDDFIALQGNIHILKLIQFLDDILYLGMAIPLIIEAKALCLIAYELHLQVVISSYLCHHFAESHILKGLVNG